MRLRINIYVQHLLGGGHLVRMRGLAAGLVCVPGIGVVLMSGVELVMGGKIWGMNSCSCRAVKVAAGDFSRLLDGDGVPVSDGFLARRRDELLARVRADSPQVLVVETYPFGRRALRFELQPLLRNGHGDAAATVADLFGARYFAGARRQTLSRDRHRDARLV